MNGQEATSGLATGRLARVAIGRDVEVFAWDDDKVIRVMRKAELEPRARREATALAAAQAAGAPVPRLYGRVRIGGRAGLLVERLDPTDMLQRLGRAPWSVRAVARTLGNVHARLHALDAPPALPSVSELARQRIEASALPRNVRQELLCLLETLPDGDRLLHGDFNPANLLHRIGTPEYVASDWIDSGRGHPAADVAQTTVMILLGAIPDDTPPLFRRGASIGRRALRAGYLRAYTRERDLDLTLVSRWETIWKAVNPPDPPPRQAPAW